MNQSAHQYANDADAPRDEAADLAAQLDALLEQEAEAAGLHEVDDGDGSAATDADDDVSAETPDAPDPAPQAAAAQASPAPPAAASAAESADVEANVDPVDASASDDDGDHDPPAMSDIGEELGEQIQSLLDEASARQMLDPAAGAAADVADTTDEPADEALAGIFEAPGQLQAAPPASAPAPEVPGPAASAPEAPAPEAPAEPSAAQGPATAAAADVAPDERDAVQDEQPATASVADEADGDAGASDRAGEDAHLIDQIDQMLADQAEEALGELQSVEEVLAEDEQASPDEPAPDAPDDAPAPIKTKADAEADASSKAVASDVDDAEDADDLGGGFEAPDALLDRGAKAASADAAHGAPVAANPLAASAAHSASAEDVAAELDDQPETLARAGRDDGDLDEDVDEDVDEDDELDAGDADQREHDSLDEAAGEGARRRWHNPLAAGERLALAGCAMINRPLDAFEPETRTLVGYVAGLVASSGLLAVLYGLLS